MLGIDLFGTASAVPMGLGMAVSLAATIVLLWFVVRPLRATRIGDGDAGCSAGAH